MKSLLVLALTLSLGIMFFSCTGTDSQALKLTSELPSGVLPRDAVIALTFSRGVVPVDSLNLWTGTPFIEFTPPVPGKFVWQDTSRLVFSPDQPFAGDAKFSGKLNTSLLKSLSHATGYKGADEFTFSTGRFMLKTAEFFYDRIGEKRQVGIKANLEFTYMVNPQDIAAAIKVTIDDVPQQIARVVTQEKNRLIALEVGTVTQLEKPRNISIAFDDKLVSPETSTRIWMERPFTYQLPPLAELKIYGHEVGFDGMTSWIKVTTSQEVDEAAAKANITIDPVRDFTVTNDGMGFTIRGKFEPGTAFRLLIKKGMESVLGGKTQNDYPADIVIGNVAPSFRFTSSSGVYMLMGGGRKLEVRTVNMPKLFVRVSQVFQNNLVYFLDNGRSYDYYGGDESGEDEDGGSWRAKYRYVLANFGRQLSVDTLVTNGAANREAVSSIDLNRFLNNGYKGFYLVEIANPAEPWRTTSKLVSISDLGLIVKQSPDEVMVFVVSLLTNKPVSGALVTLVSTNNQVIATAKSGSDGEVKFSDYRVAAKDFTLKLVTAEADNDFNFINLADYRVETSRFDVGGKSDAQGVYDAFLYGDRNIYRPGEKIIASAVVRNLNEALPSGMPVKLKIYNPRGTVVSEQQFSLSDEGSCEASYQTQATAATGEYRLELYTGNNTFLSSYKVSVEDFVPDRLRLTLTASQETARPGETIKYDLLALNFFGPPAAGRNWEFEGSFDVVPYVSKRFPAFRFYDDGAKNYSANPEVYTGKTDEQGKAAIEFAMPGDLTSTGLLRGKGRVAVFDESGRPVYQLAQTIVYPKDYFIGIRYQGAYYVSPNTPQKIQIVAVDPTDRPLAGFPAKIELIRHEWHSVLRQHQGTNTLRYVSERIEIVEKTDHIRLPDTSCEYTYMTPRSGDYVVRVSKEGESGYNQFSFYSYSWGTTDVTSFEVNPEARVEIVFDKPVYAPGEKARVLFQTPFNGRMLVTVERNREFSYRYLDVANNAASMDLAVDDKFLPNAYVSAVLFRRIKDEDIPLLAGHGFAPLFVERKTNKLEVSIKAPERIRPRGKQKVTVVAGNEKNVFVTLAAVDEGICQVKNYRTPDPYGYFYARKTLETETFDFFKHLIQEAKQPKGSSTGGSEAEMAKRANPLGVQRFKPLALWSGILRTNGSGEAEVTLDIPEFNGELRLMALAYKGDRFGSAQLPMKVSDPVVITPALPRFLSPGDSIVMPVTAFNTTAKPAALQFAVLTEGPVSAVSKASSLDIGPNQERFVNFALRSAAGIGKATVMVRTDAFGETLQSTTELPVRPAAPFSSEAVTGMIDGGKSVSHDVPDLFLSYGRRAYLTLSPYPVANFAKELAYLIGYPHGCLEQTVSKAFPQIYLRDIAMVLAPSTLNTGSPIYFVNEAITKITSMQLYDGSFSYWPGEAVANRWATVYATHFLIEARKAGFAVSEGTLKSALGAVAGIARSKLTQDYYSYANNQTTVRRIADKGTVYALYVLALGGSPEKAVMDFYRGEKVLLVNDTKYLLAGAYALSGDRGAYNEILPSQFAVEEAVRESGWNFDSPIRANALMLNILLETDLNNPNIPRLMEYLSSHYHSGWWYSTQDDAFTLLAFGKAARMATATKAEGTITVGGKSYAYKGGNQKIDVEPFGKNVTIAMKGEGRIYYSLVTEGIRSDGAVKIEDKNLQVRRELLDRNGNAVNQGGIKQNDLIVVRITLTSSVNDLDNIAITDLLPAGFELENPRITEATNYAFIKNPASADYMDIRDDRINLYTAIRGGRRQMQFYYAVRAVTQGVFQYAPVVAEAMYNADYRSASGGGRLRVGR
jgi:alpha-2-macroglobulin